MNTPQPSRGEIGYTVSSGNVFADLGFEQPEEELAKAQLVGRIAHLIEERGLTQAQAADMLGLDQPKVSVLLRGCFGGYSLERLFRLLLALDSDVAIVVRPKREDRALECQRVVTS